ncbi:MAG: hypothetical protein LKI17_06380 [Megasphaera cerevisiae]|nr:hypothetical protein [Megasphaera cerevisiae]
MVLRGHRLDYFFSLTKTEKLFCHAAMEVQMEHEATLAGLRRRRDQEDVLSAMMTGRGD